MVSWLRTYGTTAKLRAPCECTRKVMLLGACGYRSLWLWFIMELHWCVIFRGYLPWNNFCVVCQNDQATSIRIYWIKRAYHFHVWSLFFDLDSDYLYKFPLHPLCKGETLELFSVERQLISSQNEDWFFPAVEMQEFVHSLSYLIHVSPNQVDNASRMKKRMNNMTK